jgi:hypothetical protein
LAAIGKQVFIAGEINESGMAGVQTALNVKAGPV